ncbi:MAG: SMC-Scp complex subunit ScpB [Ignavibacteria bacterium]|jgi:segregation and condensation protein B|nr:SMC-Scp complex subunit ScpB [Ignavibacteria bacterium]
MEADLPLFLTLSREEQRAIIEALIFVANPDEILTEENIFSIVLYDTEAINKNRKTSIEDNEKIILPTSKEEFTELENIASAKNFTVEEIAKIIEEINLELDNSNRPYRIVKYAGGYQFVTLPQYGEQVQRMLQSKTRKSFSNAQLETLAIIAYKQPTTKQEIDRIRGVTSSSETINILIEKDLVFVAGRKDVLGKPLLYKTTPNFLKTFGLDSIADLPKLRELEEIADQKLKEVSEEVPEKVFNITQEDVEKLGESISTFSMENSNNSAENGDESN